jgi:nucleoside-diphosphate-sugar epimerase
MTRTGVVTGAAGFIGSHLCDRLIADGWDVIGVDDMSAGNMENLKQLEGNPRFRFIHADVTRSAELEKLQVDSPDCVFHHAGKKMVFSTKFPREDLQTNIAGTLNMLMWSTEHKAKRFTMASSIAVYGNPKTPPSREDSEILPTNPYGVSKKACEEYCRLWYREYKLPVIVFRYASVYGPRQGINVGVVNAFISRMRKEEPLSVFSDGNNTRPFTYVDDIVQANVLAANSTDPKILGDVFNVGMDKSVSVNELVDAISSKMKKKPVVKHEAERVGEVKHMVADISKIQRVMKFKPTVPLAEGISRTVDYYATK